MEDKSNISEADNAVSRHHAWGHVVIKRDWKMFTSSKSTTITTDIHEKIWIRNKWPMVLSAGLVEIVGCFFSQPSQFPSHSIIEGLSITHPLIPSVSMVGVSPTSAFQAADL